MERTLFMVKADAVSKGYAGAILAMYEANGLKIVHLHRMVPTEDILRRHYVAHVEKPFFPSLLEFMTSGEAIIGIIEAEEAIKKLRELNGATDPKEARIGTIRYLYAESKTKNAVHGSDSIESAEAEISIWKEAIGWSDLKH